MRQLKAGDQVPILIPTDNHKLLLQWKGPFPVLERVGPTDYRIQLQAGVKVFHINNLVTTWSFLVRTIFDKCGEENTTK